MANELDNALDQVLEKLTSDQAYVIARDVITQAKAGNREYAALVVRALEKVGRGEGPPMSGITVRFVRPGDNA